MTKNDANKQIITYVILVFALSAPFYYLINQHGGLEVESAAIYVFPLMWMPALAELKTFLGL